MRKSIIITFDFPPKKGGISNSLWNICQNLPRNKFVILTEPTELDLSTNFKVYRKKLITESNLIWPKWFPLLYYLKRLIKKENIELIQAAQILPFGTIALIFKKIYQIPYFVYIYGQDLVIMRNSRRKMWLIKKILKNSDAIIANSNYTKSEAVELGAKKEKIIIVYPSPNEFDNFAVEQSALESFLEKYHLRNRRIILTVGNLVKRKGQDLVIKVLPRLLKKFPKIFYVIVGSGPYKDILLDQIKKLDLSNYVKILERVDNRELPFFYQTSDVFIMATREIKNSQNYVIDVEGFGMVFLEANLFSKPVIGGKSGGVPEAIEHDLSGLMVNPENEHEIIQALTKILENQEYAQKLGEQGRERVFKQFQLPKQVEKIKSAL